MLFLNLHLTNYSKVVTLTSPKLCVAQHFHAGGKPGFEERFVVCKVKMLVLWWKDRNGNKTVQRLLFKEQVI